MNWEACTNPWVLLLVCIMLYLYCIGEGGKLAVGKREANWTKSPPEVFLVG